MSTFIRLVLLLPSLLLVSCAWNLGPKLPPGDAATISAAMVEPSLLNAGGPYERYTLSVLAVTKAGERYRIPVPRGQFNRNHDSYVEGRPVLVPAEDLTIALTSRFRDSRNGRIMMCNKEVQFSAKKGEHYSTTLRMYRLKSDDTEWRCTASVDHGEYSGVALANKGPTLGTEVALNNF